MDLKIALVSLGQKSFYGNKETRYAKCAKELRAFLSPLNADLFVYAPQIITPDDAGIALKAIDAEEPDLLLVQCTSFSAGYLAQIFIRSKYPIGWWAIPENLEGKVCEYNSFCSINMYQAINRAYFDRERYPAKWFFGEVGDDLFAPRFRVTVRALRGVKRLKKSRIALIGGIAPGFNDLYFDERKLLRLFPGLEYDRLPEFDDIARLAESYPEREIVDMAEAYVRACSSVDAAGKRHAMLSARLLRAYREFAQANRYDALAISCWPKFQSRYDYSVCSVVGQLNDDGIPTSCEGDPLSAACMLMLSEITSKPTMLMDMSGFDPKDDTVLLWHCGPAAKAFASGDGYSLGLNYSGKAHEGGLTGTGCTRDMVFCANAVTIGQFSTELDSLFVAGGDFLDPDAKASFAGSRGWLGNLTLGAERIGALDLVNTILSKGISHHYSVAMGDCRAELMEIAAWLKIGTCERTPYKPWLQMG